MKANIASQNLKKKQQTLKLKLSKMLNLLFKGLGHQVDYRLFKTLFSFFPIPESNVFFTNITTGNTQLLLPPYRLFLSNFVFQFSRTRGLLHQISQKFGLCHCGRDITPCFSASKTNCFIQRFQNTRII